MGFEIRQDRTPRGPKALVREREEYFRLMDRGLTAGGVTDGFARVSAPARGGLGVARPPLQTRSTSPGKDTDRSPGSSPARLSNQDRGLGRVTGRNTSTQFLSTCK